VFTLEAAATRLDLTSGGGVNVWVARHLALRFEIRDHAHIDPSEIPGRSGFVAFRLGVTFK